MAGSDDDAIEAPAHKVSIRININDIKADHSSSSPPSPSDPTSSSSISSVSLAPASPRSSSSTVSLTDEEEAVLLSPKSRPNLPSRIRTFSLSHFGDSRHKKVGTAAITIVPASSSSTSSSPPNPSPASSSSAPNSNSVLAQSTGSSSSPASRSSSTGRLSSFSTSPGNPSRSSSSRKSSRLGRKKREKKDQRDSQEEVGDGEHHTVVQLRKSDPDTASGDEHNRGSSSDSSAVESHSSSSLDCFPLSLPETNTLDSSPSLDSPKIDTPSGRLTTSRSMGRLDSISHEDSISETSISDSSLTDQPTPPKRRPDTIEKPPEDKKLNKPANARPTILSLLHKKGKKKPKGGKGDISSPIHHESTSLTVSPSISGSPLPSTTLDDQYSTSTSSSSSSSNSGSNMSGPNSTSGSGPSGGGSGSAASSHQLQFSLRDAVLVTSCHELSVLDSQSFSLSTSRKELRKRLEKVEKEASQTSESLEEISNQEAAVRQKVTRMREAIKKISCSEDINDIASAFSDSDLKPLTEFQPATPNLSKESQLLLSSDGRFVKAGTLRELVSMLTHPHFYSSHYVSSFLLTYRSFTSPEKLLEELFARWNTSREELLRLAEIEMAKQAKPPPAAETSAYPRGLPCPTPNETTDQEFTDPEYIEKGSPEDPPPVETKQSEISSSLSTSTTGTEITNDTIDTTQSNIEDIQKSNSSTHSSSNSSSSTTHSSSNSSSSTTHSSSDSSSSTTNPSSDSTSHSPSPSSPSSPSSTSSSKTSSAADSSLSSHSPSDSSASTTSSSSDSSSSLSSTSSPSKSSDTTEASKQPTSPSDTSPAFQRRWKITPSGSDGLRPRGQTLLGARRTVSMIPPVGIVAASSPLDIQRPSSPAQFFPEASSPSSSSSSPASSNPSPSTSPAAEKLPKGLDPESMERQFTSGEEEFSSEGTQNEEFSLEQEADRLLGKIRLRAIAFLKLWIRDSWSDFEFNPTLVFNLSLWLQSYVNDDKYIQACEGLRQTFMRKVMRVSSAIEMKGTHLSPGLFPPPILPLKVQIDQPDAFFLFDPIELARQMTLAEQRLFQAIESRELQNQNWNNARKIVLAPNVSKLVARVNSTAAWVMNSIVGQVKVKVRVKRIEKWIKIAQAFRELGNFNGVMEILSGLGITPVYRLKKSWGMVEPRVIAQYEELKTLMSPNQNSGAYRTLLRSLNPPLVPYIGSVLTDLTFTDDANPDFLDQDKTVINFQKRQQIASLIEGLLHFQSPSYALHEVETIQHLINENLESKHHGQDVLHAISKVLEP